MTRRLLAFRCAVSVCALPACAVASIACGSSSSSALPPVAPGVTPAAFEVRLERAQRPGDRGRVSTVVRSRRATVVTEGDRIVRREDEDREVDLEAVVEVLGVDAAGAPRSLAYTLQHLIVQTPAGRTEVLPSGWLVSAERGGAKVTLRSANPLPAEALKALDEILSPLPSESTDDEVFGTPEPRYVGAIWPVNATLAARELADMHLDVPAEAVRGESQLVGLVEVAGQVCLDVAGELSIHDPRLIDAPGTESAELRSTYRTLLPVDGTSPAIDATLRVDLDVTTLVALGPGREGRMTTTSHQEKRRRFMPLR